MSQNNQKLEWCLARMGKDNNWWVTEVSDAIHWDVDGLGLVDPRQLSYILEQCDALREYGFDADVVDEAFTSLKIDREEKNDSLRLVRTNESLLDDDNTHFGLPDVIDEEKGPYADFLDQITRFRVKMLNDLIEFDQSLTVDELEEAIRERHNQEYMEGKAVHPFVEVVSILEYVPDGYELDEEESRKEADAEDIADLPDFEEENEKIEQDETMVWDEDENEDDTDQEEDLSSDFEDEED
jgi:hypothetical protein